MNGIDKFNWPQMFNNSKGKTSASLFGGTMILLTSCFTFLLASIAMGLMLVFKYEKDVNVIGFFNSLLMQSIAFAAVGASLIATHRLSKDKSVEEEKKEDK